MDSMPDAWEAANGLDPQQYDAQDRSDGDGWSNYAEYMAEHQPAAGLEPSEPVADRCSSATMACRRTARLVVMAYQNADMDTAPILGTAGSGQIKTASEVIGAGDGKDQNYSGQLRQRSIVRGSVRVRRLNRDCRHAGVRFQRRLPPATGCSSANYLQLRGRHGTPWSSTTRRANTLSRGLRMRVTRWGAP